MKSQQEALKSLRSEGAVRREREHRQRIQRLIPIAIFAVIALLIAKQEIPAVDGWISRLIDAEGWKAIEACTEQARARLTEPGYARLVQRGEAERTGEGYYVNGLVFSELRSNGSERNYRFSCNVDAEGRVVTLSDTGAAPGKMPTGQQQAGEGAPVADH